MLPGEFSKKQTKWKKPIVECKYCSATMNEKFMKRHVEHSCIIYRREQLKKAKMVISTPVVPEKVPLEEMGLPEEPKVSEFIPAPRPIEPLIKASIQASIRDLIETSAPVPIDAPGQVASHRNSVQVPVDTPVEVLTVASSLPQTIIIQKQSVLNVEQDDHGFFDLTITEYW